MFDERTYAPSSASALAAPQQRVTSCARAAQICRHQVLCPAGAWSKLDGKLVAAAQRDAASTGARSGTTQGPVLLGMSVDQLKEMVVDMGAPQYRGKQIFDKLMQGVASIDDLNQVRISLWRLCQG